MLSWFDRAFTFNLPPQALPVVLERLRGAAPRIEDKVKSLSPAILTRRDGEAWSIQEHIGHLLDLDELHSARIDDFLAHAPVLRAADLGNKKTHAANHNRRAIQELLQEFRRERNKFVERVESAAAGGLDHVAQHPRLQQPMRLIDMAVFVAEHDDHHLARMTELARLFRRS